MKSIVLSEYPDVHFGEGVDIRGSSVTIRPGAKIGNNVKIECEFIDIGHDTVIEHDSVVKSIGQTKMTRFVVGDNCLIGFRSQILVPEFVMNDYSQLHNSALCSGYKPLLIGFNCWIGQNAILNSFENLTLMNNVRMGGSQIWTHVASGELLEGSNFFGSQPVVLEDNVWLMGFGHLVSPGVIIRKGSVIMAGSTVTKSTEAYRTYSGIPARDVSDKLPAWTAKSLREKFDLMGTFVTEFKTANAKFANEIRLVSSKDLGDTDVRATMQIKDTPRVYVCESVDLSQMLNSPNSIFDLKTKKYLKRRSEIEICFMKFNLGYRARFIPFSKD